MFTRATLLLFSITFIASIPASAQSKPASKKMRFAAAKGPGATSVENIKLPPGFQAELLYEVPMESEGSWVSLTVDPKGRLLASDQYGSIYRIDVSGESARVNRLEGDFGMAHGMLCAFDSLYINVNGGKEVKSGIYRLTDTNGDDQYDKKEHLIELVGRGEHGPHALILSPDGKQIYIASGNTTNLPDEVPHSRVPRNWSEDHLLGSIPDARGHNAGRLAPGGWVARMDPDGSDFEIISTGFRNEYDIAFNPSGELFTYDADMEWDVGTAWYRPTRVNHVVSGGEFGWRNGAGKWPAYYPDSLGAAVDIGPGSPTGIVFGTGAKFPAKYQHALYICDWSYGNIFAVHLDPQGSSYIGKFETFATASPLPVTDIIVHPDGYMYFTIGGRRVQSALYRVKYTGDESTAPAKPRDTAQAKNLRAIRHSLEAMHGGPHEGAVAAGVKHLGHPDRNIRFAARIAIEHQPVDTWRGKVLEGENADALITGAIALARCGEAVDKAKAIEKLSALRFASLSARQQIDLCRAYSLLFVRLGEPSKDERRGVLKQLNRHLPSNNADVNKELAQVLIYLNAKDIAPRVVRLLENAPTQEDQMRFAFVLREFENWDNQSQADYFAWFREAAASRGGMSFGGFLKNIRDIAIKKLSPADKTRLGDLLKAPKPRDPLAGLAPRDLVKKWQVNDLEGALDQKHQPNFERGKQMFAVGQCFKCHRISGNGGILGPDLTGAGGRFSPKDLLAAIIDPNKEISDQYSATQFVTIDGQVITGKIVNLKGDTYRVMTDMFDPSKQTQIKTDDIETMRQARSSMMPAGLLNTLSEEEILDLLSYLRAGGQSDHAVYK